MKMFMIFTALLLYPSVPTHKAHLPSPSPRKLVAPDRVDFVVQTEYPPKSNAQPEPGKAMVVVISQVWSPIEVGMDSDWVGANQGHSYNSFSVDPGEHHLCAEWKVGCGSKGKKVSLTSFIAEPGKIYFFRARMVPTWRGDLKGSNAFDLELINPDQGEFLLESLPRSTSHPKAKIFLSPSILIPVTSTCCVGWACR